ncbi:ABC transporter permease [[Muricauda] lutisoli]|uniref:ABC transporter permease n=1 Tax=[Muricauda] lutisoli TaxID=2816035 RepID=A0ABS3EW28_9FLAO|nr:ABC transporter permease [[Muricauda] lutisoli]MBO0330347.1 ABC transporter permease [[Muricauda] lutisoli]
MMFLKLAWLNIWRNGRRTMITVASVFFAVLLAITFRSVTDGVYENMIHNVVSYSSGYLQIHKKGYWDEQSIENSFEADEEFSKRLLDNPRVTGLMPRLETFALSSFADKTKGVMVLGIDPTSEEKVNQLNEKVVEGIYFESNSADQILIGSGLAEQLNAKVNDTLVLIGQGYHASSAAGKFNIVGILKLGSPELNSNVIYMPLKTSQYLHGAENRLTSLSIMLGKTSDLESSKEAIENVIDTEAYEVMTWKQMMPEMDQFIEADSSGHYIVIGILYIIISFGLFGTLLMMTFERNREFGILIAIGMKKHLLAYVIQLESIMISLMGCLMGVLGGILIVHLLTEYPVQFSGSLREVYEDYGFEPIIYFSGNIRIFIYQTLIVLVLATLLSLYPGFKVLRLRPVDAINS